MLEQLVMVPHKSQVASGLLRRIIPSSRYGGLRPLAKGSRILHVEQTQTDLVVLI